MVPILYTPREHHHVTSPAAYRERHRRALEALAARGARYRVHEDDTPIAARVDANSWIVDCACGAGNATDPEWALACCFGCGCVHTRVLFPPDHAAIAAALLERPRPHDRAWRPGETVDDLRREHEAPDGERR